MIELRGGLLAAVALAAALTTPAFAAGQKKPAAAPPPAAATAAATLGSAGSWTAYASRDSTGKVCYVVGQPRKSEPAGLPRKPPTAMVTHRPVEKISNVVSFVEGYLLQDGSDVSVDIGGHKFELFTKDDSAWARTAELDKTIVAALAKGTQAVVKGIPQKGSATTDVYLLAGFPKALALIDKACGVKREDGASPPHAPHKRAAGQR